MRRKYLHNFIGNGAQGCSSVGTTIKCARWWETDQNQTNRVSPKRIRRSRREKVKMKLFAVFLIVVVVCLSNVSGFLWTILQSKYCLSNLKGCSTTTTTTTVCARNNNSNNCRRFRNVCVYNYNNCVSPRYTRVGNIFCTNLAVNAEGACNTALTVG